MINVKFRILELGTWDLGLGIFTWNFPFRLEPLQKSSGAKIRGIRLPESMAPEQRFDYYN
jgi:hypothetical protein